jgi:RNA ligase
MVRLASLNEKLDGTAATGSDAEGWVIRYSSGVRAKVKIAEYVRLHKILTGVNARDVWRALAVSVIGDRIDAKRTAQALNCSAADIEALRKVPDPLGAILENVPDEFDQWVRGICADLQGHADALLGEIESAFEELAPLREDRGAFARAAQALAPEIRAALFLMLDGKELALHIWRTIKPEVTTPFRDDEEG